MSAPATAIFVEPLGTLRSALVERKAFLDSRLPGQMYTSHPPHCTLLVGAYGPPNIWLGTLRARLSRVAALELETDGWQEFPDDSLASGGHTVAYRAKLTPALLGLQQAVAEILGVHQEARSVVHPLADREPFAASLRDYGYPFVGPHWIPHFTIGAPRVRVGDPLISLLMSGPYRHTMHVGTVSVWTVEGDRHKRLQELELAKPANRELHHGAQR